MARGRRPPATLAAFTALTIAVGSIAIAGAIAISALRGDVRALDARLATSAPAASIAPSADIAAVLAKASTSVVTVETSWATGTGFAVSPARPVHGVTAILTCAHVIAHADRVWIRYDGTRYPATVESRDEHHDLALLSIDAVVPVLASPPPGEQTNVGDIVYAIGHPYLLDLTITMGVVSRLDPDLVQTDATIGPGNSGGPLIDVHGHVVGIVMAHVGFRRGPGEGMARAIGVACERLLAC